MKFHLRLGCGERVGGASNPGFVSEGQLLPTLRALDQMGLRHQRLQDRVVHEHTGEGYPDTDSISEYATSVVSVCFFQECEEDVAQGLLGMSAADVRAAFRSPRYGQFPSRSGI